MAGTAKEVDQGIEFSVYTFEKTKSAADQGKWQMQGTQTQMADALKAAEQLFDTGQHTKRRLSWSRASVHWTLS